MLVVMVVKQLVGVGWYSEGCANVLEANRKQIARQQVLMAKIDKFSQRFFMRWILVGDHWQT